MIRSIRWQWVVPAFLAVIALVGLRSFTNQRAVEWEARADSALAFAATESARADSMAALAAANEKWAAALAASALERETRVEERLVFVREQAVPDTCLAFTAPRDTIITELQGAGAIWRAAYQEQARASGMLRISNGHLRVANDSLTAVLEARPGPRSRWIPEIGAGLFAGACMSGPCTGAGVTLSWRIL